MTADQPAPRCQSCGGYGGSVQMFCPACNGTGLAPSAAAGPSPSTVEEARVARVDAIVLVDRFRDACRDKDTISWRDTSYEARSRAWSDAREALLQWMFAHVPDPSERTRRGQLEEAVVAALNILTLLKGDKEWEASIDPTRIFLRDALAAVPGEPQAERQRMEVMLTDKLEGAREFRREGPLGPGGTVAIWRSDTGVPWFVPIAVERAIERAAAPGVAPAPRAHEENT